MQDWRDGFRALLTVSKAFFPYVLVKSPGVIVALLPVAIGSMMLDMKASREHAVLKLDDGEILVPVKPRIQRIAAYSLMADCLMIIILALFLSGYDNVVLTNASVLYGIYLLETSGAKAAVEAYRPELEKEILVENIN